MNTKEEVKQKQVESAIDYRRYYINYFNERIIKEEMKWAAIEEQNRELSNKGLGELKI